MSLYNAARTVAFVGDTHVGFSLQSRLDECADDHRWFNDKIAYRVMLGDLTEHSFEDEWTQCLAYLDAIGPAGLWQPIAGNHDLSSVHDISYYVARTGVAQNWTVALAHFWIVTLSADVESETVPQTLSSTTLDYLDDQLTAAAAAGVDVMVISHGALKDTVLGTYASTGPFFSSHPDAEIRAILAAHPNARTWISSHSHTPVDMVGTVKLEKLAEDRYIAAINCPAPAYTTPRPDTSAETIDQDNCSYFVTIYPTYLEVRCRDHRTRKWRTIRGKLVTTLFKDPAPVTAYSGASPLFMLNAETGTRDTAGAVTVATHGAAAKISGGLYGDRWDCAAGGISVQVGAVNARIRGDRGTLLLRTALRGPLAAQRCLIDFGELTEDGFGKMQVEYNTTPDPDDELELTTNVRAVGAASSEIARLFAVTSPYGDEHAEVLCYWWRWYDSDMEIGIGHDDRWPVQREDWMPISSTKRLYFGVGRGGSARPSNAYIESAVIFDRSLTDEELFAIMDIPRAWVWDDFTLPVSGFSVSRAVPTDLLTISRSIAS